MSVICNTRRLSQSSIELKKIVLEDKPLIDGYFNRFRVPLSDYTFANNYIWFENADGYYSIINGNLCLFIRNQFLSMLLPPIGDQKLFETLVECFEIMNAENEDHHDSKIDFVHDGFLENVDFEIFSVERQNPDYIYLTSEITELRGNKYKTKRNEINYFTKNFSFSYQPYRTEMRDMAMDLIYRWAKLRYETSKDKCCYSHFVELIELERNAISRVLDHHEDLGLSGAVIVINDKIEGITFGEKIDQNTASILIEKTNFEYFGISQYLFREFCHRAFPDCNLVNVGDDLGFENLRRVKMSYHPYSYGPKYIIRQKSGLPCKP